MKIEIRQVFVAWDGKEFTDEEQAKEYELMLELKAKLDEAEILDWRDTSPEEVASYLVRFFDFTVKEQE